MHGGKGSGRPLKHGRYSKYLPARLIERHEAAKADPDLLALRDEIALVDARVMEIGERLSSGESRAAWTAAGQALEVLEAAIATGNTRGFRAGLEQLEKAVRGSQLIAEREAWQKILDLIERRRRLVETERRRLEALQQMLTAEQAMALAARVVDIVQRHVLDEETRRKIAADLRALLS